MLIISSCTTTQTTSQEAHCDIALPYWINVSQWNKCTLARQPYYTMTVSHWPYIYSNLWGASNLKSGYLTIINYNKLPIWKTAIHSSERCKIGFITSLFRYSSGICAGRFYIIYKWFTIFCCIRISVYVCRWYYNKWYNRHGYHTIE